MKKLILFTIIIYAVACNNDNMHKQGIKDINTTNRLVLSFSTIFEDFSFVKLETIDESIIGYIDKLIIKNHNFNILSRKAIYIFDGNGKFISKIDKKGKGNGEYLDITEFYIDNENNIIILDKLNKKILTYNILGEPINEIKNDYLYLAKSFIYLNEGVVAIFGDTGWGNNYRLIILDIKNNKVLIFLSR